MIFDAILPAVNGAGSSVRVHAPSVQSFDYATTQRLSGVVAAAGSLPVGPSDSVATVSALREFGLQPGDLSCRLTETIEQLTALVQMLLAGRGGTGDEIVRTNVQSGRLVGQ